MAERDRQQQNNDQPICGQPLPPENVPSAFGSSVNPLVSYSPSLSYTSVSLYNSVDGNQTFIEIKANFEEIITGQNTLRWYDDKRILDYLRIRCIVSLGERSSRDLDAIQQRTNEYIALSSDSQSPEQYINELNRNLTPRQRKLIGEDGPFDFAGLVPKVRLNPYYYYNSNDNFSDFSDVFLYDIPASQLLMKDYEGTLTVSRVQDVSAGERVGDTGNRNYVLEKTFLKDMVFKIGAEQEYIDQTINHLSVYTYAYLDMESYARDNNLENRPSTTLSAGSGFINPGVFIGNFHVFGDGLIDPTQVLDSPNSDILNDLRLSNETNIDRFNTILYDTFISSLQRTLIGRGFADIIKDRNHFSDLWISRAENDNVRYMFAFDLRAFLIQDSKFPFLYLMPESYRQLMQGGEFIQTNENSPGMVDERTQILDYVMKRRENFQNSYESNNDLPTSLRKKPKGPDYYAPEKVLPAPRENRGIFLPDNFVEQQSGLSSMVFYEGFDDLSEEIQSQVVARFQYNTKFLVKDSANLLIQRCAEKLRTAEKKVEEIYNLILNSPTGQTVKNTSIEHGIGITIPEETEEQHMPDGIITNGVGLFDYRTLTRRVPLELIGVLDEGVIRSAKDVLRDQIQTYVNCLKFTGAAVMVSYNAIQNQLLTAINHPDLNGIEQTAKTIQFFAAMLEGISNDLNPGDRYHEGGKEKSILKTRGFCQRKLVILEAKNHFDNIYDLGKTYNTGYEYLVDGDNNTEQPGLVRISKGQHTSRAAEEFYKYFDFTTRDISQAVADRQASESFIRGETPFSSGYANSSYVYYTPKNIKKYGKSTIVQPSYKIQNSLKENYDVNKYGKLFADLISIKSLSKYLDKVYTLLEGETIEDTKNLQTYNSVVDSLLRESCYIEEGFSVSDPDLTPKLFDGKPSTEENVQEGYRLLPYIFGGGLDRTTTVLDFFNDTENSIKTETREDDSKGSDNKIKEPAAREELPIKLAFGILGELTLERDGVGNQNYEELLFNSLKNLVLKLGIDNRNVKQKIETEFSNFPNQVKSMLVLASSKDILDEPLGNGFQVVRSVLDDLDPGRDDQVVSEYVISQFPDPADTKDPMKVYSKFLTFWMNYKQMIRVEYLAGFNKLDATHFIRNYRNLGEVEMLNNPIFSKAKMPIWKPITLDVLQSNQTRNFLCRLMPISDEEEYAEGLSTANDYFSLPIYNKYFVLEGSVPQESQPTPTNNLGGLVGGASTGESTVAETTTSSPVVSATVTGVTSQVSQISSVANTGFSSGGSFY